MQYRVFTIPCTGDADAEEAMNTFLRAHRVVSVAKELVALSEGMSWCFCVEYLSGGENHIENRSFDKTTGRVDYKKLLSDDDFALFAKLRDVRKEIALQEAVPVYTVCTNEHLSQMAVNRPQSLEDLKKISGFGGGKTKKYGSLFLAVIEPSNKQEEEQRA